MSCVQDVRLRLQDLDAVEAACKELGVTFHREAATYVAHEGRQPCVAAIEVAGSRYTVGVVAQADGAYGVEYDTWGTEGRAITAKLGANLDKLRQEYAVQVALKKAQAMARRGWSARRETLASGTVRVALRRSR